ncbi:hypothetical protein RDABS01_024930 [Bienertia sinuspersici]
MADELTTKCAQLSITSEEDDVVEFLEDIDNTHEEKLELSLVGKVQSVRPYNFNALKNTMNQVWTLSKKAVFREIENNLFIIQFFHWKDKEKVLNGRPWTFDQNLLILQDFDSSVQPSTVQLNKCPFWVRIYNLPFDCRTIDHAKAVASKIGEVVEFEDDIIGWDRSMRVKVLLNTLAPLRRFQKIKNRKGVICWVEFKYERLPFFCFQCGIMGHTEKDCLEENTESEEKGRQWGAWLRASPRKGQAKREEEIQRLGKGKKALIFCPKSKAVKYPESNVVDHDQQEGQNIAPPLQINEPSTNLTGEGNGYNRRRDEGNDDAVASFGVKINDADIGGEVARCLLHARDPVPPTETLVLQPHVTHNNADHESVTNSKEKVERKICRVNILKKEALPQHMGGGKNDEGSVRAGDKRKLTDAMDIDVNEDNISAQRGEKKGKANSEDIATCRSLKVAEVVVNPPREEQ